MQTLHESHLHFGGSRIWRLVPNALLVQCLRARLAKYQAGFVPPCEQHTLSGSKYVPVPIQSGVVALGFSGTGERPSVLLAHRDLLTFGCVANADAVLVLCAQEDCLHHDTRHAVPALL